MRQPCPRTQALWLPGVPIEGVFCWFSYTGTIPCTGPQVCGLCGRRKDET